MGADKKWGCGRRPKRAYEQKKPKESFFCLFLNVSHAFLPHLKNEFLRSNLHVAMYFSMVRLSACCAGLLSRSTSFKTTSLKPILALAPITGAVCAISLITS